MAFSKLSRKEPILFLLPALLVLLSIIIFPLIYSLYMAFHKYILTMVGVAPSFIGVDNFIRMISDSRLVNSLRVTFILAFGATAIEFFFGLGLALALMVETKISPIMRGVLIMIAVTPSIVAAYIWRMLYNPLWSPLNYILHGLFNFPEEFEWTSNVAYALPSIILVDFWQWTPFMTLVLLAGLFALRLDVQEAARVDGASKWQIFRYIIFPLLKPLALIVILIRFMDAVKIFDILYILTKGGPGTATETISFYIFVVGFNRFNIGYAAALSWVALFIVEIISIMFIFTLRRE